MSNYIIIPKNTHYLFEVVEKLKELKISYRIIPVPHGIKAPCSSAVLVNKNLAHDIEGMYIKYEKFSKIKQKDKPTYKFSNKVKNFIFKLYSGKFSKRIPEFNEKDKNLLYLLADEIREKNFGKSFFIFKKELNNKYFKTKIIKKFSNIGKANLIIVDGLDIFETALIRVLYKRSFLGFKWRNNIDYTNYIKKSGVNAFIVDDVNKIKNLIEGFGFEVIEN
ncbi:MAG: DUF3343 domain-containing protein [bacterium]|nr:DUF3343 domain-containing protein [bacterium]